MWSGHLLFRPLTVLLTAALALGAAVAGGAPAAARTDEQRSWPLYASVEHRGKPVAGLTPAGFRVLVDDREQEFTIEAPDVPASVIFLVEAGQRAWPYHRQVGEAIEAFLGRAPEGNWYALATFDQRPEILVDFTKRPHEIVSAFWNLREPQWDGIATYNALCDILDRASELAGRKIVVFIGSGVDNFSERSFGDVEKRLESTDVTLYTIGLGAASASHDGTASNMGPDLELLQIRGFLSSVARKTGGDVWFPSYESMFRMAMDRIVQDLNSQYKLMIKGPIPADARFHRIKVEAFTVIGEKRKNLQVRVREGIRK